LNHNLYGSLFARVRFCFSPRLERGASGVAEALGVVVEGGGGSGVLTEEAPTRVLMAVDLNAAVAIGERRN